MFYNYEMYRLEHAERLEKARRQQEAQDLIEELHLNGRKRKRKRG